MLNKGELFLVFKLKSKVFNFLLVSEILVVGFFNRFLFIKLEMFFDISFFF